MRSVFLPRRRWMVVVAAAALAACTTPPEIRRDTHPSADFARYRTFAYFSPLATDKAGYETAFTSRLKAATRRAMEGKGYVYSESAPDLLVNFYANMETRQELRSYPGSMGYYGYRQGFYGGLGMTAVETYTYHEGTLTIDLLESQRKLLIWQATAEGTVSDEARRNSGPAIDAAVAELMAPLPEAGQAARP